MTGTKLLEFLNENVKRACALLSGSVANTEKAAILFDNIESALVEFKRQSHSSALNSNDNTPQSSLSLSLIDQLFGSITTYPTEKEFRIELKLYMDKLIAARSASRRDFDSGSASVFNALDMATDLLNGVCESFVKLRFIVNA